MTKPLRDHSSSGARPDENEEQFSVLKNTEDQYWVWSEYNDAAPPVGWAEVMKGGYRQCEAYLREHWTDLRPRSLRG